MAALFPSLMPCLAPVIMPPSIVTEASEPALIIESSLLPSFPLMEPILSMLFSLFKVIIYRYVVSCVDICGLLP